MSKILQRVLLGVGVVTLLILIVEITLSVAATSHGNTPVRVVRVDAGPYPLTVSLYKDPANAGFALPFAIAPQQPISGHLSYDVTSQPEIGPHATPVRASITPDPDVPNGAQGAAEITVQGIWALRINVSGPQGNGYAEVPITATAPPAIPDWLGWLVGFIPLAGLLLFLLLQRKDKRGSGEMQQETVQVAP